MKPNFVKLDCRDTLIDLRGGNGGGASVFCSIGLCLPHRPIFGVVVVVVCTSFAYCFWFSSDRVRSGLVVTLVQNKSMTRINNNKFCKIILCYYLHTHSTHVC